MRALLRRLETLTEARGTVVVLKDLPEVLRKVLREVEYKRRDIGVEPRERVNLNPYAGEGEKGFAAVVNLATGKYEVLRGDWGGTGGLSGRSIDSDRAEHAIPPDGAVVVGSQGSYGTFATIYVSPMSLAPLLPGEVEMSDREAGILRAMGSTSAYRKELFDRLGVQPADIDAMVGRGWIARNKAGALSLTTAGKNAAQAAHARR